MEENESTGTGTPETEARTNMVGVIRGGKFIPYGLTSIIGGKPVYIFNTYADYEAAAPLLPEECLVVTLDDLDTGGFEFDSELSETSENAPQNKTVTIALKSMDEEREILAQQAQGIYTGRNLADVFDAEIAKYADEWEWMKDRISMAFYKGLYVADFIPLTLTDGEYLEQQIAGIDTYHKSTDQNVGHHIDFVSRNCLSETIKWNTSNNNNGRSDNPSPYMCSYVKNYLLVTIFPKFPESARSVISEKRTFVESRYSEGGIIEDSNSWSAQTIGKLWIPSEFEIFSSVIFGTKGYSSGQQIQYPIFSKSYKNRIKKLGNSGGICTWWTSTVRSGSGLSCCCVASDGRAYSGYASTGFGVPICFRIQE